MDEPMMKNVFFGHREVPWKFCPGQKLQMKSILWKIVSWLKFQIQFILKFSSVFSDFFFVFRKRNSKIFSWVPLPNHSLIRCAGRNKSSLIGCYSNDWPRVELWPFYSNMVHATLELLLTVTNFTGTPFRLLAASLAN